MRPLRCPANRRHGAAFIRLRDRRPKPSAPLAGALPLAVSFRRCGRRDGDRRRRPGPALPPRRRRSPCPAGVREPHRDLDRVRRGGIRRTGQGRAGAGGSRKPSSPSLLPSWRTSPDEHPPGTGSPAAAGGPLAGALAGHCQRRPSCETAAEPAGAGPGLLDRLLSRDPQPVAARPGGWAGRRDPHGASFYLARIWRPPITRSAAPRGSGHRASDPESAVFLADDLHAGLLSTVAAAVDAAPGPAAGC